MSLTPLRHGLVALLLAHAAKIKTTIELTPVAIRWFLPCKNKRSIPERLTQFFSGVALGKNFLRVARTPAPARRLSPRAYAGFLPCMAGVGRAPYRRPWGHTHQK